jgi:hypothetical protein
MTDYASDQLLKKVLLDAVAEEYAAELNSTEKVTTSLQFQHQMEQMLTNPNAWAKRRKRPLWRKCLHIAAMFVLVCSLTLGTIVIASPTARAAVVEWVVEWYETHVVYRFFSSSDSEDMPRYDITALPSGYDSVGEINKLTESVVIRYRNKEEMIIYFEYAHTGSGSALIVKTENMEISEVKVNGYNGYLYLSSDSQESNAIIWYDEREKIQFLIDGFVNKEELLKMANSISLSKMTK